MKKWLTDVCKTLFGNLIFLFRFAIADAPRFFWILFSVRLLHFKPLFARIILAFSFYLFVPEASAFLAL